MESKREFMPFDAAENAVGIAFFFGAAEDRAALERAVLEHGRQCAARLRDALQEIADACSCACVTMGSDGDLGQGFCPKHVALEGLQGEA